MTQTEINAAFNDKVRRGIFKPVTRHLTDPTTAEDRLQIAIALTWLMYSVYVLEKGKVLSDAVLVHSCRQRAVDLNRDFVPANGTCRNQDVLDPRAYRDGKVEVHRLDGVAPDQCPEGDRASEIAYAQAMAIRPERKWNSAIDLEAWVDGQTTFDQLILEKRYEGHTLSAIAADLGVSLSTVDYRSKKLGFELAARAGVTIDLERERRGRRREARHVH
jgi:hypothetical protein